MHMYMCLVISGWCSYLWNQRITCWCQPKTNGYTCDINHLGKEQKTNKQGLNYLIGSGYFGQQEVVVFTYSYGQRHSRQLCLPKMAAKNCTDKTHSIAHELGQHLKVNIHGNLRQLKHFYKFILRIRLYPCTLLNLSQRTDIRRYFWRKSICAGLVTRISSFA